MTPKYLWASSDVLLPDLIAICRAQVRHVDLHAQVQSGVLAVVLFVPVGYTGHQQLAIDFIGLIPLDLDSFEPFFDLENHPAPDIVINLHIIDDLLRFCDGC